ncbi:hypothetical protein MJA45_26645 [Paenibacillus aurantius]|uniref:Uncharacterized protein n=1 Tax=Paenibacillus aurantius TaxID=2918900 RepID=A0AA96LCH5_9BACL|nr:hypothetical protein [Paenibacillus aurantius]WNQ11136.1 hypothetical protein MJA45_26645 [Paenibacillus aurantius]
MKRFDRDPKVEKKKPLTMDRLLQDHPELSSVEREVYQVVAHGLAHSRDIAEIARRTQLSELQAGVAVQLLTYKNLL